MLEESLRGGFSSWFCIFYLILPQDGKIAILVVAMFFVPCDGLGPTVLCDLYRSVGAFFLFVLVSCPWVRREPLPSPRVPILLAGMGWAPPTLPLL